MPKQILTRITTKLYKKGHIHNPEDLPHQHQLRDYFQIHQIGKKRGFSPLNELKTWWITHKRKYIELEKRKPIVGYAAMAIVLVFGVSLLDGIGENLFKASVLESPLKFDGTVYPFKKAPDWFHTGGKNTRHYSDYKSSELVNAPKYDIPTMQKDGWIQNIVNPKITYSIVYSGQYEFNHKEYLGSHPAVDIKLAPGTPVTVIANGVVTKAVKKTTGFGQHIVVRHDGVPEYGTLYSSYSHLSKIEVKVGQIVEKGEQIGLVGSTGASTTPHIHFQIDKKTAPFHPYWPFTSSDAKAAGVSFSGAVTAGVGKNNVKKYTINPFNFINKYQKGFSGNTKNSRGSLKSAPTQTHKTVQSTPKSKSKPKDTILPFHELQISASPTKILEGDTTLIKLLAIDKNGNTVRNFNEKISIKYKDNGEEKSRRVSMRYGEGQVKISLNKKGNTLIMAEYEGKRDSVRVRVNTRPKVEADTNATGKAENFKTFQLTGEKAVREGETIFITLRALDTKGNAIASKEFPAKGAYTVKAKNGVVKPFKISKGDFEAGKILLSFKGKKRGKANIEINGVFHEVTVLQAIATDDSVSEANSISTKAEEKIVAQKEDTTPKVFSDVSQSDTHAKAIAYLKEHKIVGGYADGSFQPNKTVSRAEALKMIFSAFKLNATPNIDNPFEDVTSNEWFSSYVLAAYDMEIVSGYDDGKFKPSKTVNRSEYFKILLNTADVPVEEEISSDPFNDTPLDSWFAPYADFAKNEDLLNFGNNFEPTKGITRGEMAESLYRLMK